MSQYQYESDEEINFLDYWKIFTKWKKLIGVIVLLGTISVAFVSLFSPKTYVAEAVIMPVGKGGGGGGLANVINQFGGLASLVGVGGGQNAAQQFLALLQTRTLFEHIISQYNLIPVFFGNRQQAGVVASDKAVMERAVKRLKGSHMKFDDDKKLGVIRIKAEFEDPKLAAEIANAFVQGLQFFINKNQLTVAKRNRIFIEWQLKKNKQKLLEAGKSLNEFYKSGQVSNVESKVDVPIERDNMDDLVYYSSLFFGLDNDHKTDYLDMIGRTAEMEEKMNDAVVVTSVPQQVYLQYLTLNRKLLEEVNSLLTQQYEVAKIEEAKDELAFQVIDPAREPTSRFKPQRKRMVTVAFAVSSFVGIFTAFLADYLGKQRGKLEMVKE